MDLRISIKAARVNAGMSQKDAALALGISKDTLGNWEKGKTAPRATMLTKFSEVYQIPIDAISLPM